MSTLELLDAEPAAAPIDTAQAVALLRTTALAPLNAVDAGIAALRDSYGGKVFPVATTKGIEEARAARLAIRTARYKVPHIVKAKRAELKSIADDIATEGDRIVAALLEIEEPIDTQITTEEERKANEKAAKEQAERERLKMLDEAIAGIAAAPADLAGQSAAAIAEAMDSVRAEDVTLERFGDHAGRAVQAQQRALAKLAEMHTVAIAAEAERTAQSAERDRLEALRISQEAAQKQLEQERADFAAMQAKVLADQQAKQAEIDRKAREQQEEQDRLTREAREADERAEKARQQRAQDVQARIDAFGRAAKGMEVNNASYVDQAIAILEAQPITADQFDGRAEEAAEARRVALDSLWRLHSEAVEHERLQAEQQAEAARQRDAQAAAAQREREAAEAKAAEVDRLNENAAAMRDAITGLLACPAIADVELDSNSAYMVENAEAVLAQVRGDVQPIAIPAEAAVIGAALDPESLEQGEVA